MFVFDQWWYLIFKILLADTNDMMVLLCIPN